MKKRWLWLALFVAILGSGFAISSIQGYVELHIKGFDDLKECLGGGNACHIVNASSYASLLGIPVAAWGLLYYIALAVLIIWALVVASSSPLTSAVALFLSLVGLLFSARMAYLLFFELELACYKCIGGHISNILLVLLLGVASGREGLRMIGSALFWRRTPRYAFVVAIIFGVGWAVTSKGVERQQRGSMAGVSIEEKLRAHALGSLYPVEVKGEWPVWGNPHAKVAIVEFSDFECPYCREAALNLRPFLQEFKGSIQFRFVNYPLDRSCNAKMQRDLHQHACNAAKAAICSQEKNGFWEFHDELFRHQKNLSLDEIARLWADQGWEREELSICLASDDTEVRLQRDIAEAHRLYVSGTPTIFLNGRKVRYWSDGHFLQALIRKELKR